MAVENITSAVPETLIFPIKSLIYVVQALGVVAIVYVGYLIFSAFFQRKKYQQIDKISKNVEEIKKILSKK